MRSNSTCRMSLLPPRQKGKAVDGVQLHMAGGSYRRRTSCMSWIATLLEVHLGRCGALCATTAHLLIHMRQVSMTDTASHAATKCDIAGCCARTCRIAWRCTCGLQCHANSLRRDSAPTLGCIRIGSFMQAHGILEIMHPGVVPCSTAEQSPRETSVCFAGQLGHVAYHQAAAGCMHVRGPGLRPMYGGCR